MKLIDLLVQELPKRGGWPEGAVECERYLHEAQIDFYDKDGNWGADCGKVYGHDFAAACVKPREKGDGVRIERVTREQYEAALAAAQQPVWDAEGLPPVGCECEAKYRDAANAEWFIFRCVGVDCGVAFGWAGKEAVTLDRDSYEFRPIRPEADTKRAAGVTALAKAGGAVDFEYGRKTIDGELSAPGWYELYDKIAAGEIAGIRIE
ncbi:hypothetical protein SMY42_004038 [Cronobacter sakazakii]|uniref:hypothetical protein n=2 Tax=Cronobacter sakazakii TaxID=28141 RepID=UPI0021B5BE98|nr:hypothetical protein [Cronobacter sakazakii]ELY2490379.1 hypothetical protein [Cronobacter sakazakii]ELY4086990.1 hypothetical protein [Cronobacter sakazakii]ELY4360911.1 hypothetical protein [Cronobacter sakazakii]ELY5808678.1 hypothetical protein [Cronobacter sakazakii]ELY5893872.1 hypothetical protein [Cronobacter sakazakii]